MEDDRFISPAEVAQMLQLSLRTLDHYRRAGTGPDYSRFNNRGRYRQRDVKAWAKNLMAGTDAGPEGAGRRSVD